MTLTIKNYRAQSWNEIYSGTHWSVRQRLASEIHALVYKEIREMGVSLISQPVNIFITAYFDKRPIDSDNVMSKLWVDGLKGYVIIDDTPKYVHWVGTRSLKTKNKPYVEIDINLVTP